MADYAFNPGAVRVAITGNVFYTELPFASVKDAVEDVTFDLTADPRFKSLGVLSEDALESDFSDETESTSSWQSGNVRTLVKSREATVKLAALQTSREAVSLFYGLRPQDIQGGVFNVQAAVARPSMVVVFEFKDGNLKGSSTERVFRIVMPLAQVSEVESPKFTSGEAITWGMTFSALGGASGASGALLKLVTNDEAMQSRNAVSLWVDDQITTDGKLSVSATPGATVTVAGKSITATAGPDKVDSGLIKGQVARVLVTATKAGLDDARQAAIIAYP
ncbi:hypothetical protein ACFZCK_14190 [Kitasatospora purpeofusca]|uniref:phage tail tube protein n=1 Tax=Kitasatospora purpeofusca TaxID=67352 RepID=UPI0036F0FD04